jgi:UDPglucose 6-dehydrogenase
MSYKISVFGLGKVGHVLATCLATAGHQVVGYDPEPARAEQVNRRAVDSFEPGILERLATIPADKLTATTDAVKAATDTDVSFVIVPTPSNAQNGFSLRYILEACENLKKAIAAKRTPHVISITSTVLPGSSDHIIIPALLKGLGPDDQKRVHYAYNPSFIALGEVVKGMEQPDYVLLGTYSEFARETLAKIHASMIKNDAPLAPMRPIEAEITKIASNTHETMRVSFANMVMAFCEEIGGANSDTVTNALSHRLGRRFFKGAVPYGGPCWPRDNKALAAIMGTVNVDSIMPKAIDSYNATHGDYVTGIVLARSKPGDTVGLISLSYKTSAPTLDRAYGIELAHKLMQEGRMVAAYDPHVGTEARDVLQGKLKLHATLPDLLKNTDYAVVINPIAELQQLKESDMAQASIIDPWRAVPQALAEHAKFYAAPGSGAKPVIAMPDFVEQLKALCT